MTRRGWLLTVSAGLARSAARPLPPAIASLPNRRAEAHPITRAEREGRIERARALMQANRLDGMVVAGGTSLEYFTGIRWGNSERLFAFVLPRAIRSMSARPSSRTGCRNRRATLHWDANRRFSPGRKMTIHTV